MYQPIRVDRKGFSVYITILAAILATIYGNNVYAADKERPPDKGLRSEEELIDEWRAEVYKHLEDKEGPKAEKKKIVEEREPEPQDFPEIPEVTEDIEEPANQPTSEPANQSDVTPVVVKDVKKPDSPGQNEGAKEIDFVIGKKPFSEEAMLEPVLKRMDVDKIGASPYYETYEGLRLLKYFTVAQRVEIYQEPRPVDSYIMDAFAMPKVHLNTPWNIKSDYRTQITPLFTRAYGTEITMSDPKNKEGQIRYTHDYREIYRNYYPKYPEIKREMWDQNEILFMHSKQLDPIGWNYTSNLGYRYSTMDAKKSDPPVANEKTYYEVRHTYFGSLALAPTDKLEWFGQAEYFKSMHVKSYYNTRPDHFLGRTEIRIKSNDMKTMYVPSFSYSKDYYYPLADTYQKYEIQYRVGRDFTKRFSAASTIKYVMGLRDSPDNTGPQYIPGVTNAFKDKAYAISLENRFSYNVYDRLYLQAGIDLSNGLNFSAFDNWGMLAGLEYYAPGMIRVDFGWRGNHYYNIQDFLSTLYFKFFLFM